MVEHVATILGGLPVIADVAFGKDADTPNGPGEYWAGGSGGTLLAEAMGPRESNTLQIVPRSTIRPSAT